MHLNHLKEYLKMFNLFKQKHKVCLVCGFHFTIKPRLLRLDQNSFHFDCLVPDKWPDLCEIHHAEKFKEYQEQEYLKRWANENKEVIKQLNACHEGDSLMVNWVNGHNYSKVCTIRRKPIEPENIQEPIADAIEKQATQVAQYLIAYSEHLSDKKLSNAAKLVAKKLMGN